MFYCYILFSTTLNKYYIGSTSDLNGRLRRHQSNHKGYTGATSDWVLKWKEGFLEKNEVLIREKEIKKWKSSQMIEKLIAESNS